MCKICGYVGRGYKIVHKEFEDIAKEDSRKRDTWHVHMYWDDSISLQLLIMLIELMIMLDAIHLVSSSKSYSPS